VTDPDDDVALVVRARRGDDAACRLLVERHQAAVARTVVGMLGSSDEADDAGQDTFVRFFNSLDQFRGESSVRTYLTRIAMSTALNALRSRRRRDLRFVRDEVALEQAVDAATTRTPPAGTESVRAAQIREALDRLSPEHRAVVVLRLLDERSTRETADVLQVPEGTVLSRLSRAVHHLRHSLGPVWKEFSE
jgi:RNA polymerase sigma-70 factor, ECF subfamily